MKIDDSKIIESFNRVAESGHPDPIGFLARADIKTGFDYDGEYKGAVGVFGVDKKQALNLGFTEDELSTTDGNLAAALEVDMSNLRKAEGDIDEMYKMSNAGSKVGTDRFVSKLTKQREKLEKELVFNEGALTDLKKPRSAEGSNGKVVYKESRSIGSADDVKDQANAFGFSDGDQSKIDGLLSKLVHTLIDEKPLDAA